MNLLTRYCVVAFLIIAAPLPLQAFDGLHVKRHVDHKNGFSIAYPDEWSASPAIDPLTVFKINRVVDGRPETCSIAIHNDQALKKITPEAFLQPEHQRELESVFLYKVKSLDPNAAIEDSGFTSLFNRRAFWAILQLHLSSMNTNVTYKLFEVVTNKGPRIYYFSCGAVAGDFENDFSLFQALIGTVIFLE